MSTMRYWKVIAVLALVFGAGAVTGSVLTHQFIKHRVERALNFEHWKSGVVEVLNSKLRLTPQQEKKIQVLVDERGSEIRTAFTAAFQQSGHVLVGLQKQIDQELTPEQREIHAKMKRDFRAELKRRFNFDLPEE